MMQDGPVTNEDGSQDSPLNYRKIYVNSKNANIRKYSPTHRNLELYDKMCKLKSLLALPQPDLDDVRKLNIALGKVAPSYLLLKHIDDSDFLTTQQENLSQDVRSHRVVLSNEAKLERISVLEQKRKEFISTKTYKGQDNKPFVTFEELTELARLKSVIFCLKSQGLISLPNAQKKNIKRKSIDGAENKEVNLTTAINNEVKEEMELVIAATTLANIKDHEDRLLDEQIYELTNPKKKRKRH